MKDLQEFTAVYVNPKVRNMTLCAYAVVAPYPTDFPIIKNACIKWAWKQPTKKGWCQVPPSISHRLCDESKYGMRGFMLQLEWAMLALSKFASTVVEDLKTKTKWIAEVEISIITRAFAAPNSQDGNTFEQHEDELSEQCAAFIATKLLFWADQPGFEGHIKSLPSNTKLMGRVHEHVSNLDVQRGETNKKKQESAVAETLTPKVILMDRDGRPVSGHETMVTKQQVAVDTIAWSTWAEKQTQRNDKDMAKLMLMLAMGMLHDHATTTIPISCVKSGSAIKAFATRTIEAGELVVPLLFKHQSSMVTVGEGVNVHPKAVCAVVSWAVTPSDADREAGREGESENRTVPVHVQPELKLPTKGEKGWDWTLSDAVHPYWFIKRTDKDDSEANAHLVYQDMTHVQQCYLEPLSSAVAALAPATEPFSASQPFIVNMQKIVAGGKVILKWTQPPAKSRNPAPEANAFDQIAQSDKKKRRAMEKGTGK